VWSKRIQHLGAAAVGAAAIWVWLPSATPANAEPCKPGVVQAPGCTPVGPPPIESPGAPEAGPGPEAADAPAPPPIESPAVAEAGPPPNPCNDLGYFFANTAICMNPGVGEAVAGNPGT
jgi:hypothetical protein